MVVMVLIIVPIPILQHPAFAYLLVSREWRNGNYCKYHYYHSSIPY